MRKNPEIQKRPKQRRRAFSIKETTEVTGLSRATLYRAIRAGTLATVKVGSLAPAPRANAGSRADFKAQRNDNITSAREGKAGGAGLDRISKPHDRLRASGRIDFDAINNAALAAFPAILARILPGGKRVGSEIVAFNPRRADRRNSNNSVQPVTR